MRRTLAGLLFGVAFICAAIAISGWMLQRTAFNPDRTADLADVVLGDEKIRNELINLIADATAEQLGLDPVAARVKAADTLNTPQGAALMADVLRDAHAHLIGERDEPVQITGPQMVLVMRTELVADLPPVTLPVPSISALSVANNVLRVLVPLAAIAAVVLAIAGLTAHPERSALMRSFGFGLLLLAALVLVLGYLIPRFVVPLLSDSPWANAPQRLADHSLPFLIAMELLLVGAGLGLLAAAGMTRRKQRWSTPVTKYRYSEERRWS